MKNEMSRAWFIATFAGCLMGTIVIISAFAWTQVLLWNDSGASILLAVPFVFIIGMIWVTWEFATRGRVQ